MTPPPPTAIKLSALDLPDGTLTATSFTGPLGAQWSARETLTLFARVDDPEGVREVAVWGTTKHTCVAASGLATTRGPGLATAPLAVSTHVPEPGEMARTAREIHYTIQARDFSCPAGSRQLIVEQVFWAAGNNFGGGAITSNTLTLTYVRPSDPERRRPIGGDPFSGDAALHSSVVEPDTFSNGSTVVAVFQAGRFAQGGAASGIGFARSVDSGKTWTSGYLPNVTKFSGGEADRATDPSIAYDAKHDVWLASVLHLHEPFGQMYPEGPSHYAVSRSTDNGETWTDPVIAVPMPPGATGWVHDQGWVACDNWSESSHFGRCYLAEINLPRDNVPKEAQGLFVVHSDDGGLNWSLPVAAGDGGSPKIVVLSKSGDVVVMSHGTGVMQSTRSKDGGETFEPPVSMGPNTGVHAIFAGPEILTADRATSDGLIYAAWTSCALRGCPAASNGNDIVSTSSSDGVTWAPIRAVVKDGAHHVMPGLAVDPDSRGASSRIVIQFYSMTGAACDANCEIDVSFVSSTDAGATWSAPRTIDDLTSPIGWHAYRVVSGRRSYFVGDYVSSSFADSKFVAVFPLASREPIEAGLTQPLWSATIEVP